VTRSAVADTVTVAVRRLWPGPATVVAVRVGCEGCRLATGLDQAMDGGDSADTARSITEWRKLSLFWTWGVGGVTQIKRTLARSHAHTHMQARARMHAHGSARAPSDSSAARDFARIPERSARASRLRSSRKAMPQSSTERRWKRWQKGNRG
jgi:hypothetical protein